MSKSTLNIPNKIKVGFQNRQGTYTGKLAYIIYYDQKGKLRKEGSWNSWRDKNIPDQEFDNVPTDGFVLNKKVGDYSSRWGGRRAYTRVYDPRGFEFEIGIDNLIFILEECSSIKGKGLEGEFIYAWDGKNLVLLPTSCGEYQESLDFTRLQTKKVTKKDMTEGCLYKTKDNETVMYLGRHKWYEHDCGWGTNFHALKEIKLHVFLEIDSGNYWTQKGFTKLAEKLDDKPSADFANEYDKFKNSKNSSPYAKSVVVERKEKVDPEKWRYRERHAFIKKGGRYYRAKLEKRYRKETGEYDRYMIYLANHPVEFLSSGIKAPSVGYTWNQRWSGVDNKLLTLKELQSMKFYDIFMEAENGARIKI